MKADKLKKKSLKYEINHVLFFAGDYLPGVIEVPLTSYSFGPMTVSDLSASSSSAAVSEVSNGEVMVEVMPERYEVTVKKVASNQRSGPKPKVTRQDVVLAKSSLFRFDEGRDREARLQKVLSYDYEKSEYYGQVRRE